MKIVIAPDSYKNCLTARQVVLAIKHGLCSKNADADMVLLPASDGGEGFLDSVKDVLDCQIVTIDVHNPQMQSTKAQIGICGTTAIIESAQAIGFGSNNYGNILSNTSYGVGEMILAALNLHCRDIIIGLGGSTTNDGGMGMMQALGVDFFNHSGHLIPHNGNHIVDVCRCDCSNLHAALKDGNITIAADVSSPLCGEYGATMMFGKQKGATPEDQDMLEAAMNKYASVVAQTTSTDYATFSGAGAAGGIAFSLLSFCNAHIVSGGELWMHTIDFTSAIADADVIITGEGKSDAQTLMNKLPYLVLTECKRQNKKCCLLSGQVTNPDIFQTAGFDIVAQATPQSLPLEEAMKPNIAFENIVNTAAMLTI